MDYKIDGDTIIIPKQLEFNPKQILECGQIFRYNIYGEGCVVYSGNKTAKVIENNENYLVISNDSKYFANFFDLESNYETFKNALKQDKVLRKCVPFGEGIRILKNNIIEIIFSFVISANNNIKRIKQIIEKLCSAGDWCDGFYAFPTIKQLASLPLEFYSSLGAGYRDRYLYKLSHQLENIDISQMAKLSTADLRTWLISLSGIGPKVADCILLFGFSRWDVFPVDTWIEKVYNVCYCNNNNGNKTRTQIREYFINKYKNLSGLAQQYLFYGARSFDVLAEFNKIDKYTNTQIKKWANKQVGQ